FGWSELRISFAAGSAASGPSGAIRGRRSRIAGSLLRRLSSGSRAVASTGTRSAERLAPRSTVGPRQEPIETETADRGRADLADEPRRAPLADSGEQPEQRPDDGDDGELSRLDAEIEAEQRGDE